MKHKAKPSGSSGGSRLRLTLLLAAAAALLLVPAAAASAANNSHVVIEGTGSGTVVGTGETPGEPPINCSYASPGPQEGVCDTEAQESEFEIDSLVVGAEAAPGSAFAGWTVEGEVLPFENCEEPEVGFCTVFLFEGEMTIKAAFNDEPGFPLTVTKEGEGSGTVVSSPAGIECGSKCTKSYEGTEVTLTASPAAGSAFTSWKGCGTVEGRKCKVTVSAAKEVKAKFSPTYNVTVKKTTGATGLGGVSGVTCDANCSSATAAFVVGKAATLKPKASKGSAFTEWSSCPGEIVESVNCKMTSAGTAEAKFTAIPKFSLTVNKTGGGQGTVKSKPSSISCGLTCSTQTSSFQEGIEVELTASVTLGKGSSFGGWSVGAGTCTGLTNPCKVTMSSAKSVTAKFE